MIAKYRIMQIREILKGCAVDSWFLHKVPESFEVHQYYILICSH